MSIRNHPILSICIVFVIIGLLLIPSVSAVSSVVTSPTGKLIITPWGTPSTSTTSYQTGISDKWFVFASGGVSLVPPPPTIEELYGYNLSSTACGVYGCGENGDSPVNQILGETSVDFGFTSNTACCLGNPFIKPYSNVSIYYPESTASGLKNSFGTKGFHSSYF